MTSSQLSLLICMNGIETTAPAVDYGLWLADLIKLQVVLLGITEHTKDKQDVDRQINAAARQAEELDIPFSVRLDDGPVRDVIARHAITGCFLSVVGPLGRPVLRRVVRGRSFRRLLKNVSTPILYVRESHHKLDHMLICLGGLDHIIGVVRLCISLAQRCNARITLLHVVEPISLQYPISKEIEEHWSNIIQTDTPQGKSILLAKEAVEAAHMHVQVKVRYGTIVHEIIEEVRRGNYDILGMGSQYSAHSLRRLYLPNITAEVVEAVQIPILTAREGNELINAI